MKNSTSAFSGKVAVSAALPAGELLPLRAVLADVTLLKTLGASHARVLAGRVDVELALTLLMTHLTTQVALNGTGAWSGSRT